MDVTVAWLLALGILTSLLGCCVLFALRQMTVLRASFNKINADIITVQKQQADTAKLLDQSVLGEEKGREAATLQTAESTELLAKLKRLEQDISTLQQTRQERSVKIAEPGSMSERRATFVVNNSSTVGESPLGANESLSDIKRVTSTILSSSPSALNDSRGAEKMYQEILAELREMHSANITLPNAAGSSTLLHGKGSSQLSFATPPSVSVYEEQQVDPSISGTRFKRRLMSFTASTDRGDAAITLGPLEGTSSTTPATTGGGVDYILLKEIVTIRLNCDIMPGDHGECVAVEFSRQLPAQRKVVRPTLKSSAAYSVRLQIPQCPAAEAWVNFLNEQCPEKIVLGNMNKL